MADPFDTVFDDIGEDYEENFPNRPVTVRRINPDTGATVTTVSNVPATKRVRSRRPFAVGGDGRLPADQCRFVLRASAVGFEPKEKDEITDAESVVWTVDERGVELIAGTNTTAQLYIVQVSKKRS